MTIINPNKFEKIRREEGLKNLDDIWDLATLDDIKQELEQHASTTKELVSMEGLTVETKRCIEKTRVFCNELSEDFKETFISLLNQYQEERRQVSQKIVDYLLEKKFFSPNLTIANKEQAQTVLEELGFPGEIDERNVLLVFQLPKPLAQYWWKGGADSWGDLAMDVEDRVIEWGHFYRELMRIVWQAQARHENESGLDFYRLNDIGEHDPQKYYYVWEVSEWND